MSSAEEIKAMQSRLFAEFFSQGKQEVADEIFASDHVYYNPGTPEGIRDPEGMKLTEFYEVRPATLRRSA